MSLRKATRVEAAEAPLAVQVYSPDRQRGWGWIVWCQMMDELIRSRELIWRLFVRDFAARYKQSVLGVSWALLMPLAMTGMIAVLNRAGVMNVGNTGVPYFAFALLGLTVWQLFASGLTVCSNAIVSGGNMVVKINFPKEALVFAAYGQVLVETLVRLGLLVVVFALYRIVPQWTIVFLPFALLPLVLLTLGLGLLFSLLTALLRDIANVVSLATTFLLFLTPVLYVDVPQGPLATITAYNPLAALVTAARNLVLDGYLTQPGAFALASLLSIAVFLFSWRLFHIVEPRLAERL